MRTLTWAIAIVVSSSGVSCTIADDYSADSIIALECGALDRWGKGDPRGYYELMADGETYFDPTTATRVDGITALKAHFAPFDGKISFDRSSIRARSTGTAPRCFSASAGRGRSSTRTGRI